MRELLARYFGDNGVLTGNHTVAAAAMVICAMSFFLLVFCLSSL